jgi:hypothetical protein
MTITSLIVPDHTELQSLTDSELLAVQADIAAWCRQGAAAAARVAGEVARRCAAELGQNGLAQRTGLHTPEALIQRVTGVTRAEARGLLRVGEMLATGSPWLAEVNASVSAGTLSVAAADAIASGLGAPTANVAADDLADAASRLVGVAGHVTPEKIAAAARAVRDDLDSSGVADREKQLRSERFLKLIPRPDGSVKLVALLDPESAAVVISAEDAVTAPRRGGPRFVDPDQPAAAAQELEDSRTTEQIALDAFVDMIRIATRADEGTVFPQRQPSVRVHVTLADLERRAAAAAAEPKAKAKAKAMGILPNASASVASVGDKTVVASGDDSVIGEDVGAIRDDQVVVDEDAAINEGTDTAPESPGYGYIEGSMASLSLESIERLACAAGYVPILFDGGQPLNLGRSQRLFSASQRLVLAARDGGCIADGCDRPPSWCEAHHIKHWYRDHGNTDVKDGVLLCHHHHMLVHNHGWEIVRIGSDYWFIPPRSVDPEQKPRPAQKRRQLCPVLA